MQDLLPGHFSVVFAVLAVWLVCKLIGSRWMWNLAIVGLIVAGATYDWPDVVRVLLVLAVLVRLLLGRRNTYSAGQPYPYDGPAIRDIIERQDRMNGR